MNNFEFLNCIYDYIAENYAIELQNFIIDAQTVDESLIYSDHEALGSYKLARNNKCKNYNGHLHRHAPPPPSTSTSAMATPTTIDRVLYCCTEVDVLAVRYLNDTLTHKNREEIILSMHDWLPAATMNYVEVSFNFDESTVESDFEPSFALAFIYKHNLAVAQLTYHYFSSNIELTYAKSPYSLTHDNSDYSIVNSNNSRAIMVRRRRSRSRSRSPGRPRSVGRPRIRRRRSRSRSYSRRNRASSPSRSSTPRRSYRRRSRSRSRSPSRR